MKDAKRLLKKSEAADELPIPPMGEKMVFLLDQIDVSLKRIEDALGLAQPPGTGRIDLIWVASTWGFRKRPEFRRWVFVQGRPAMTERITSGVVRRVRSTGEFAANVHLVRELVRDACELMTLRKNIVERIQQFMEFESLHVPKHFKCVGDAWSKADSIFRKLPPVEVQKFERARTRLSQKNEAKSINLDEV